MNLDENSLLRNTDAGLYCEQGGFFIDPWRPVDRAVVTHAHSDHLRAGCGRYLVSREGELVTRARLDAAATVDTIEYGESIDISGIRLSLHPAGHTVGSAQVRLERQGHVCVVSGDYKVDVDSSCQPFELVRCNRFISECTFGLPVFRWPAAETVFAEILNWWRANQSAGRSSMLYAYALGKAQRLMAGLADIAGGPQELPGPIYTHGAVETMTAAYRATGIRLPETIHFTDGRPEGGWSRALIIAPPSAHGSSWARRFEPMSSAIASGWMRLRGIRRRRAMDRGFVLSDHVDWPRLLATIDATGAETIVLTHGYTAVVSRWLLEKGKDASSIVTHFEGERAEMLEAAPETNTDSTLPAP